MTLCEALDWCRANSATVQFSPGMIVVTHGSQRYSADTVERAVEMASAYGTNTETVAEAAKRGFRGG